MARNKKKIALTLSGLVATQVGLFAAPASATDFVVTNCDNEGKGSLRDALESVNTGSGGDTITFDAAINCDTITALTPLYINRNVTITGPGADELSIEADATNLEGTFMINVDGQVNESLSSVSISGLTVKSPIDETGWNATAAIRVGPVIWSNLDPQDELNLTVSDSKLVAQGSNGIGISALFSGESFVSVTNSEFFGAAESGASTGIEVFGASAFIENSKFHDLQGNGVSVGSYDSNNQTSISNSTFKKTLGARAITAGSLSITNSYFGDSQDYLSVSAANDLNITNTTIVGNIFAEGSLISAGDDLVFAENTVLVTSRIAEGSYMDGNTFSASTMKIYGSILASGQSNGITCEDVSTIQGVEVVQDLGGNLLTNSSCGISAIGAQSDGSSAVVSLESLYLQEPAMNSTNPDNTGLVNTIALGEQSVARDYYTLDQINLGDLLGTFNDARGVNRPLNGAFDVGAYEADVTAQICAVKENIGSVKFKAYSSLLTKAAKKKLRSIANEISSSGCGVIVLNGFTSIDSSRAARNEISRDYLSLKRAKSVKRFLAKRLRALDVNVEFVLHAKGAENAKASNKTAAGRAENRRVEIVVKPAVG